MLSGEKIHFHLCTRFAISNAIIVLEQAFFCWKNFFCFCLTPCLYVSLCISVCMTVYLQFLCLSFYLSVCLFVCLFICLSVYLLSVYLSVCLFAVCLWLNQLLRVGVQATPVRAHRSFVNLEITKEPASRICCFVTEVDPITNIAPTISKLQSTQIKKSQWNEIQIERSQSKSQWISYPKSPWKRHPNKKPSKPHLSSCFSLSLKGKQEKTEYIVILGIETEANDWSFAFWSIGRQVPRLTCLWKSKWVGDPD